MTKLKPILFAGLFAASFAHAAPEADPQTLAMAAFKPPTVPFQADLILTEWGNGASWAEEARLYFSPPNSYRIEFLNFDGSVKKIVMTDGKNSQVTAPSFDSQPLENGLLQVPNVLTPQQMSNLMATNYTFELKGTETFIGRKVWVLDLVPRAAGKPLQELRIDQQTMVVLEQRRYVTKDQIGSLTRFSNFEPNKPMTSDLFEMDAPDDGLLTENKDVTVPPPDTTLANIPESLQKLPSGFSLNGHRTFEVQGTTADHYTYTDGALPLSIFQTKLPVRFPEKTVASEKMDAAAFPANGFTNADQAVYGKKGNKYITVIGEASPDLLHDIADHLN